MTASHMPEISVPTDLKSEYHLQRALVQHARRYAKPGTWFTAIPMGEKRNAVDGLRVKNMGGVAGAPDLVFVIEGQAKFVECKWGKGSLSKNQRTVIEDLLGAGSEVYVVENFTRGVNTLEAIGATFPVCIGGNVAA